MNDSDERSHVDRFDQMAVEARLSTAREIGRLPVPGHCDQPRHMAVLANVARQLIPIHHRQTDVDDGDVRPERFECDERLRTAGAVWILRR